MGAKVAAEALRLQFMASNHSGTSVAAPPTPALSPSSRILLAIPEDGEWLSDVDSLVRKQLEVFCATREDSILANPNAAQEGKMQPSINAGRVGFRCVHCSIARTTVGTNIAAAAVFYPSSVAGICDSVKEFRRSHLNACPNLPAIVKAELDKHGNCNSPSKNTGGASSKGGGGSPSSSSLSTLSSVLRKYYASAAAAIGLRDTDDGIRAGGMPRAEKSSSSSSLTASDNNSTPFVGSLTAAFAVADTTIETTGKEPAPVPSSTGREKDEYDHGPSGHGRGRAVSDADASRGTKRRTSVLVSEARPGLSEPLW